MFNLVIFYLSFISILFFLLATKPLTTRETEAMKQTAKLKRQNSRFRTAPDGRLMIDVDDEENQQQDQESDDDNDDDINREDLKDLMETLSLSQRAKNKRKRTLENDDDDDEGDYHLNDKQSQSAHSKYRGNSNIFNYLFLLHFFSCILSRW
jgi:hypothetical protein